MLHTVRYFGNDVDPSAYRRGYGIRGFVVFLANVVREMLERFIVLGILRLEARKAGMNEPTIRRMLAEAAADATVAKHVEYHPIVSRARRRLVRDLVASVSTEGADHAEAARQVRYRAGRPNSEAGNPLRPFEVGMARTAAAALQGQNRSLRYFHGRREFNVMNLEGDFESAMEAGMSESQNTPSSTPEAIQQQEPRVIVDPQEIARRSQQVNFDAGASTRHLRVTGLEKPRRA